MVALLLVAGPVVALLVVVALPVLGLLAVEPDP